MLLYQMEAKLTSYDTQNQPIPIDISSQVIIFGTLKGSIDYFLPHQDNL